MSTTVKVIELKILRKMGIKMMYCGAVVPVLALFKVAMIFQL